MPKSFLTLIALGLASLDAFAAAPRWTEDLLALTGSTLVFDAPEVRQYLASGQDPGDIGQLARKAGYRAWAGGQVLVLERKDKLVPFPGDAAFRNALERRNLMPAIAPAGTIDALDKALPTPTAPDATALRKQLAALKLDALAVLTNDAKGVRWRLITPDVQQGGYLETRGLPYLPHLWADSLAMAWQWPDLRQGALIHIEGLNNFGLFKSAETLLGAACQQVRLLRLQDAKADFACQTTGATVPDKLALLPSLVTTPLADPGLDDALLIGRQLGNRYASFRWQGSPGARP